MKRLPKHAKPLVLFVICLPMSLLTLLINYTNYSCDIIYCHVPVITDPFDSSTSLKYSMQSIESTQYQAALAVSGAWKGSNTSKLYEELGWESLTDRRWYRRLLQLYKIVDDLAPSYLKDIIPLLRRSLYGHPRYVAH